MHKRLQKNDVLFLSATALLLAAVLAAMLLFRGKSGKQVVITVDREVFGTYPLSQDNVVRIDTGTSVNELTIENGTAKMTEADCPDKLCMHQKAISRERETIVCLPNKIVVTVTGGGDGSLDAIVN